jgi:hypothetical protein
MLLPCYRSYQNAPGNSCRGAAGFAGHRLSRCVCEQMKAAAVEVLRRAD